MPVQHLVFMVHGIGQRLEKSNLVDDVTNFRLITAKLAERHLTSYQRGTQRVLFIPCQVDNIYSHIKQYFLFLFLFFLQFSSHDQICFDKELRALLVTLHGV